MVGDKLKSMTKIKDIPKLERPREKLIKKGPKALKKEELLAIILRTGLKGRNAIEVANDILTKYGNKKLLFETRIYLKSVA